MAHTLAVGYMDPTDHLVGTNNLLIIYINITFFSSLIHKQ